MTVTAGSRILTLSVAMGLTLLGYFGLIQEIWKYDTYLLSTAIAAFSCWAYIHGLGAPRHSHKYAEVAVGLGLLGTIIGFSLGLATVAASGNPVDILQGAFIAYHTTIVGLISAMILRVQGWLGGGEL